MDELVAFLLTANKQGYAAGEEKAWKKEHDGSTSIEFEKGRWKMHDNFFGGEPFGGRSVIFKNGVVYWMMVYYGAVDERHKNVDEVYQFLREALAKPPKKMPVRGPKTYRDKKLQYTNSWDGDLFRFTGEEYIAKVDKKIYETFYAGGFVDQRKGV